MPTYQYRCTECGRDLEVVQKFSDASLTECPACSGALRKVFNAVGVVFKGSGFYRTDSRAGAGKAESNGSDSSGSGDSGSGEKSGSGESGSGESGSGDKKTQSPVGAGASGSGDSGSGSKNGSAASPPAKATGGGGASSTGSKTAAR